MKFSRSLRILLLAAMCMIPVSSFAGVFISVGFAPPVLPVYEQPPCPEPGWMWSPGYWAYGDDGYYWVPGTWVPAPYEGAMWTPPWWGWSGGLYVFHPGYWGDHVGYYGGVNYGFGYMGVGFVGGMWRGRDFVYNTAVVRVDERMVHTTYVDRAIVQRNTIVNDRHVAFSGGPGGIHHDPAAEERFADHDRHFDATTFQHSHESAAMAERSYYARNNGGHPNNAVVQRPMGGAQDGWQHGNAVDQNQHGGNYRGSYQQPNYNPPANNGYQQNRNNNPQGSNNGNSQHVNGGNAPHQAPPQPQSRPAPPPPQQNNHSADHGDHGHDRQH